MTRRDLMVGDITRFRWAGYNDRRLGEVLLVLDRQTDLWRCHVTLSETGRVSAVHQDYLTCDDPSLGDPRG